MDFKFDSAGFWNTTAFLPSWNGNPGSSVPADELGSNAAPGCLVRLIFAPEDRDSSPLTQHELALVNWVIENERAVLDAVKTCIFRHHADMHGLACENELERLIALKTIYVHQIEKGGIPYIGFEFDCPWNVEHGLGVLMHGTRCVEVGHADTAIVLWIAERHAAAK